MEEPESLTRRTFSLSSASAPKKSLGLRHHSSSFSSAPSPKSNFFVVAASPSSVSDDTAAAASSSSSSPAAGGGGGGGGGGGLPLSTSSSSLNDSSDDFEKVSPTTSMTGMGKQQQQQQQQGKPQLFHWTLQSLSLPIPFGRAISSIPPAVTESFWVQFMTTTPLTKNKLPRDLRTLQRLVALGIPRDFRRAIWSQLALELVPSDLHLQDAFEQNLASSLEPGYTSPAVKAVAGDLDRTFPDIPDFKTIHTPKVQMMKRILYAYSIHNPVRPAVASPFPCFLPPPS